MPSYLYLIIYMFFLFFSNIITKKIQGKYPKSILLPFGNFFIVSDKGINVYNPNFTLNISLYNFTGEEIIYNTEDFLQSKQTVISKYIHNNNLYIFCLIKGSFLFIFDNNNYSLQKFNISNIDNVLYYNLIPYSYNDTTIEYIISYMNYISSEKLYQINFFKYRLTHLNNEFKNEFISYNNFVDILKKKKDDDFELFLSCQKISNYLDYNNYMICFYSEKKKKILRGTIFDIENNFTKINSTNYTYENYYLIDIVSSISNNNNIFICNNIYEDDDEYYTFFKTYCFLYDIQNNMFVNKYIYNDFCYSIDVYFFLEINEFNLICYVDKFDYEDYEAYYLDYDNKIKILKFNENFSYFNNSNQKEKTKNIDISKCLEMNTFSLIYNENNYNLISDCRENGEWYISNNSNIIEV